MCGKSEDSPEWDVIRDVSQLRNSWNCSSSPLVYTVMTNEAVFFTAREKNNRGGGPFLAATWRPVRPCFKSVSYDLFSRVKLTSIPAEGENMEGLP